MALFVGIDVSKDKFDACGIGEEGEKVFSLTAAMDRKGFEKLIFHLKGKVLPASRSRIHRLLPYRPLLLSYRKRLPGCHH